MSGKTLLILITGICGLISSSHSLSVSISPEHVHVSPGKDISIMCKADQPLAQCQFKVRHLPIYDLSQGFLTEHNNAYSYLGEGLENGDCGVKLKGIALKFVVYLVGCRARTETSDWVYAEMSLINKRRAGIPVDVSPGRKVIALPGEPIQAVVDAHRTLSGCTFVLTNDFSNTNNNFRFNFDRNSTPSDGNPKESGIEYFGAGVDKGQCGFQMKLAQEQHNDGAWIDVHTDNEEEETNFIRLIVARPPINVDISYNTTGVNDGAITLSAWCSVRSRPASNMTWFLGGQEVTAGHLEIIRDDTWIWPSNVHTIRQKLTLPINTTHSGKELWCSATHMSLKTPVESERVKIAISTPPSSPVLELDTSLLYEGAWLEASCSVLGGQPDVSITWYMGDEVLREEDISRDPEEDRRTTQRLRHLLRAGDNGRELRCEVKHQLLSQPLQATRVIRFALCSPLTSDTLLLSCWLDGDTVDCNQPHLIGTIVRLACKTGHSSSDSSVHRRIRCTRNSTWDRPLFSCTPSCGMRNTNSGTVLISNGEDSKIGEFPWHVGVYEVVTSTKVVQSCGGTLITPNTVISAAHCFWIEESRTCKDPSKLRVGLGKHIRKWDDPNPNVQKRNVSRIILPLRYNGRVTRFASDIALLRMTLHVQITATVNVICMDWDNLLDRKQLMVGNNGTVAGWGYTETKQQSDSLKYVDLPYVEDNACVSSLTHETQQGFTHDKFCAGFVNRSISVCRGDSGGGLVFVDPTGKYYLRGIVSISFTPSTFNSGCYNQHYTGFTKVSQFTRWIQDNV